jgi:hypothetical protein
LTVSDLTVNETGFVCAEALLANRFTGELYIEESAIVGDADDLSSGSVAVTKYPQGYVVAFPKSFRVPLGVTGTSNWLPVIDFRIPDE